MVTFVWRIKAYKLNILSNEVKEGMTIEITASHVAGFPESGILEGKSFYVESLLVGNGDRFKVREVGKGSVLSGLCPARRRRGRGRPRSDRNQNDRRGRRWL